MKTRLRWNWAAIADQAVGAAGAVLIVGMFWWAA